MKTFAFQFVFPGILAALAVTANADDAKEEAIKKDRERIEGTWRAVSVVIDGVEATEEDARKITVVNAADGNWTVYFENELIGGGTSTIDPTQQPKTIDFTITEGEAKGDQHLGIYGIDEKTRRLCFAPVEKERPTKFFSPPGSGNILVTFERKPNG